MGTIEFFHDRFDSSTLIPCKIWADLKYFLPSTDYQQALRVELLPKLLDDQG